MPPRATKASQSQRSARPTQFQSASRGTQRNRAASSDDDEEMEQDDEDDDDDDDGEEDEAGASQAPSGSRAKSSTAPRKSKPSGTALSEEDVKRRAYDLVRMALFEEPKRGSLKRAEISKKILGENARSFQTVFDNAQKLLRHIFGMELVELMTRNERDQLGGEDKEKKDGGGGGGKKKSAAAGSKSYILRSVLDPDLIKVANTPIDGLRQVELEDLVKTGMRHPNDDDEVWSDKPLGTILAWKSIEATELHGIGHLVLCLILVAGRSLADQALRNNLRTFNLTMTSDFTLPDHAAGDKKITTLDAYLDTLIKQGYLDKVQTALPGGAAPAAGRRKSRANNDDDGEGRWEWRWGTRAHAEIGEDAVAQFMTQFMKDQWIVEKKVELGLSDEEDEDNAGPSRRKKASGKQQSREDKIAEMEEKADQYEKRVYKDIVRDAGGNLTSVKTQ